MKKMILDLDTGVDDALAISYALGSPEVELIGITGTYGNVLMEQGVRNALAITELLGHPEVKVYRGLDHSSTTDSFQVLEISSFIHGQNGIGEVVIADSTRDAEDTPAVDFIIDAAKTYGKDLVYVPTGPLTNLDAAIARAPEIVDEIGRVVLMGGALTVPGNVNAWTEANISQDPDAANRVFRSGIPATMVGLDVTLQTLLTYKETQLARPGHPGGRIPGRHDRLLHQGLRDDRPASGRLRPARPARRGRGRRPDARDHAADQHEGGRGRPHSRAHDR